MIFVYDKASKQFVGMATRVFDNGTWREATVEELYPNADHSKLGFVQVEDSPKYALNPHVWQLKLNDQGEGIGIERKPSLPKIHLTTTAPDKDGDGMPELAADGRSSAQILIEVKDSRDRLVEKEFQLELRATGGTLSARRLSTEGGKATVDFTSSLETVTATVSAAAEGATEAALTFEFMPPGDMS
jgi:hypothetical protein